MRLFAVPRRVQNLNRTEPRTADPGTEPNREPRPSEKLEPNRTEPRGTAVRTAVRFPARSLTLNDISVD
jgi:hypothetical protein